MFDVETAYGFICLSPLYDKMEIKFPKFLEFSKKVYIEYLPGDNKSHTLLDNRVSHYESLYENGIISKEEFNHYVSLEEKKISEAYKEKLQVVQNVNGYVVYLKGRLIDVDALLHAVARFHFCMDKEDIWEKVEPLFYAILERNLEMNEENLHVYVEILSYIQSDPEYVSERIIVDRLRKLDEFKNIKSIKDVVKASSNNNLSEALEQFLTEHIKVVGEGKGDEFIKSKNILRAILSLT